MYFDVDAKVVFMRVSDGVRYDGRVRFAILALLSTAIDTFLVFSTALKSLPCLFSWERHEYPLLDLHGVLLPFTLVNSIQILCHLAMVVGC